VRYKTRLALCALALLATDVSADDTPTAHEYIPDLEENEGTLLISSGGAQPDAIVYDGEMIDRPPLSGLGRDERPMVADAGDGQRREEVGRRSPTFRPDGVTNLEGTVSYFTVFTPVIAPFKRVTALDRVVLDGDTPILTISDAHRRAVPVVGAGAPPEDGLVRDRFWGTVVLDFSAGPEVPLPSVSPDSRILSLETNPPSEIEIVRDGVDNYFARAPGAGSGQVRLVFLTDAPRDYFGRPIPDAPVDALADQVPRMPPEVQRDAQDFARQLGLGRDSTFPHALEELTRYFRSFRESDVGIRPRDGNYYRAIAEGQIGICRHRAYAFVITAQALGMHARFVQNEAHAWAEVELPAHAGWLRVDLGGAATGLNAQNARDQPIYEPHEPDPLPRPDAYEEAYEQARRMAGLRARPTPGGEGDGPLSEGDGEGGGDGNGGGGGGSAQAAPPAPGSQARGALTLALDRRDFEVFRGRELEVTGSARGNARGVAGLRVELVLRAPRGEREWLLGVTVTDEAGRFRANVGVPPELSVGDYSLDVRTPGDDTWGPAVAR